MFTDSIFVKTTKLEYNTRERMAKFGKGTDAWKEDNMLSADAGWYDRAREVFLFNRSVHALTPDKEAWSDSLFYYRNTSDVDVRGHVQLTDTTRNVSAVGGRIVYTDSLDRVVLTKNPAVIAVTDTLRRAIDTVYFGGDVMTYRVVPKCDIPEGEVKGAQSRLENLSQDAVNTYRQRAAEEARKAAEEAARKAEEQEKGMIGGGAAAKGGGMKGGPAGGPGGGGKAGGPAGPGGPAGVAPGEKSAAPGAKPPSGDESAIPPSPAPSDSTAAMPDSLSAALADSLAAAAVPKDSTKVTLLSALHNVKLYREDMQVVCDSLEYTDLDSLFRLYKEPFVWNDITRQYKADSIFVVIKNNAAEKADLLSNAFIIAREDSLCYDQIKAMEMLAYFTDKGALRRFDALGDADAILYVKEDSVYATLNKTKAKMFYAVFNDKGDIENVYYFDEVKTDAYPIAQMRSDERVLKGFDWRPSLRPKGPEDITRYTLRPSERKRYESRPKAAFKQTDAYFPGYMADVYRQMEKKEMQKAVKDSIAASKPKNVEKSKDEMLPVADSTLLKAPADSLSGIVKGAADSLSTETPLADSLSNVVTAPKVETPLDAKAQKRAEREAARKAKEAAKEAKWAEKDAKDAAKAKAKAERKAAKLRKRKLRALQRQKAQEDKEQEVLDAYLEKYRKKKAQMDAKAGIDTDADKKKETPAKKDSLSQGDPGWRIFPGSGNVSSDAAGDVKETVEKVQDVVGTVSEAIEEKSSASVKAEDGEISSEIKKED